MMMKKNKKKKESVLFMLDAAWRTADEKLHYETFGMFALSLEIISIIAILIGIIVNGYILLIVTLTKQIAYVNKILLLHLGVVNTLICFTYLTFYVMTLLNLLILVDIACILFGLSFNIMHSVALWNLCALNFDRYFAIASPLHYGALINTKKVLIGLGCGWILSILFSMPQLLLVSPYHYDTYYEVCLPNFVTSGSLVYNTSLTAFTIFLPIILILGCNMKVLMIARYQRHRIASAILEVTLSAQLTITHQRNPFFIPSFSSQVVQNSTSLKNHTHSPMSSIFQLVGSIFIIYCPYYICNLWNNTIAVFRGEHELSGGIKQSMKTDLMIPKVALQISVTFLLLSPFVNALLYGIKNKVIRKSFHNFWRKQKSKIEIHYEIQARTPSTCGSRRPSINETNSAQPLLTKQLSETFMNISKADINNKQSDMKLRSESLWSSNSKLSSYSVLNSPTGNLTVSNLTPISSNESKFVYLNPISTSSAPSTVSSTQLLDPPIPITSSSTSKITCNIMSTVKHYSSHSTKPKIKITKTFSEEKQPSPKQGITHSLDDAKIKGISNNTKSLFNLEHADDNLVMVTTERIYAPKEVKRESTAGTINSFTFKKYASLQEISITSATVTICDILK